MIIRKPSKNNCILITILTLVLFAIYYSPLKHDAIMLDRSEIIEPLEDVSSIEDYIQLYSSGKIRDVQPIRDLTHLFDLSISSDKSFEFVSTMTNILILLLSCFILIKIFESFFSQKTAYFLTSLFLVHPNTFHIFVEITNRKHILSFLFILLSFYYFIEKRFCVKSHIFYFLSLFSQPINILIPYLFQLKSKFILNKEKIKYILPFLFISFLGIICNFYYFKFIHYKEVGLSNIEYTFQFDRIILAIGLHFRQFFFPLSYSFYYTIESISLLITSIAIIPMFFLSIYKLNKKIFFASLGILTCIFFMLYGHKSNVLNLLYVNSYSLTPSFAFLLMLGTLSEKFKFYRLKIQLPILLVLISITLNYSFKRKEELSYYVTSYKSEKNCRNLVNIMSISMKNGKLGTLKEFQQDWLDMKCNPIGTHIVHLKTFVNTILILNSKDFTYKEKKKLFQSKFPQDVDQTFLSLGLNILHSPKDTKSIKILLEKFSKHEIRSYFENYTYLPNLIQSYCKKNKDSNYLISSCNQFKLYRDRVKDNEVQVNYLRTIK